MHIPIPGFKKKIEYLMSCVCHHRAQSCASSSHNASVGFGIDFNRIVTQVRIKPLKIMHLIKFSQTFYVPFTVVVFPS